ncbi:hypothetical protein ACOBQX_05920 [Actinokineospora sp. G85]|uniref:hypothetical protein n=1 Tax=Actinokineospora sp. G85 TaxID=3406626 RepID=UPI003C758299
MAPQHGDTITMTPEAVRQIADQIASDAEASRTTVDGLFTTTTTAVEQHSGWLTADALRVCGETWQKELRGLVDQSGQMAHDLLTSAETVDLADDEARQRFGAVLSELSTS